MKMFELKGRYPICDNVFMSKDCTHSYEYVCKVMEAARTGRGQFLEDVHTVIERLWESTEK